uniref:Fibronectin type-III domain-containing protein n=1 Tax=Candidatus Kentrum sp. DK TaxID=2126562 RepID=A0A450T2S7_9GAMM|nr:MAG: hypothetical protein BECKDK2373C_GA0170839_10855 [Candidatus Kentron sp. DK]
MSGPESLAEVAPTDPWIAPQPERGALTDQERGKELEYVVLARNKAGDGPVSNIVVAVL